MAIDWGQIITAAAQVAGQVASSRAQGRQQQAGTQLAQQQGQLAAHQADTNTLLQALAAIAALRQNRAGGQIDEARFSLAAPGARASNAVRGDILAHAQDASATHPRAHVVNFSGGLRPSMLSGNTRQLGREMSRQALLSQMQGDPTPYSDLPSMEPELTSVAGRRAPQPAALPQASMMDRILGAIGTYGSLAGAVLQGGRGQPEQPPSTAGDLSRSGPVIVIPGVTPGTTPPYQPTPTRNWWDVMRPPATGGA